jgi:Zn-dependent alcohol dehydrogenase
VVVRVQACGVCHTDLHYRHCGINDDFPSLLGHEAAGIIAVDLDRGKLDLARQFGATDVVDASPEDEVAAVKALTDGHGADVCIEADFPLLVDLYLQGRLDLDRFVSETIGLDDVEEAFHRMERGEVLRSLVVL